MWETARMLAKDRKEPKIRTFGYGQGTALRIRAEAAANVARFALYARPISLATCSARRGADLDEEPVRFAERPLAARFVARQSSELSALEVEEGLGAFRARPFDPGGSFGERSPDLFCGLDASSCAESANSR